VNARVWTAKTRVRSVHFGSQKLTKPGVLEVDSATSVNMMYSSIGVVGSQP
jgi:hypothetical protein